MARQPGILLLFSIFCLAASGQDTLPAFSLINKGNNRIIISWTNPYGESIHQLSIQRSTDSLRNFKSILTLPDPTVPQNGFVDAKVPDGHMFYRLYILRDSGRYVFSKSKRPVLDTSRIKEEPKAQPVEPSTEAIQNSNKDAVSNGIKPADQEKKEVARTEPARPREIPERTIYIKKRDTLIGQLGERSVKRFKDSVAFRTRDTLSYNTTDTIVIRPFVPKEVYRPSKFVFTEKDGNVKIALPQADEKKYTIRFFDENDNPMLEIKQIKERVLTLDKANFIHAGWFKFELYEDGVLREKHKLFIPKDF
jgi:hypothetical protein